MVCFNSMKIRSLLLGACIFMAAGSLSAQVEEDPIVAKVNDYEIPLSYVYQKIEGLPLGDQIDVRDGIERFTESVIQEEVLFQYILNTNVKGAEALREKIKVQVLEHLIGNHIKGQIQISDQEVYASYAANAGLMKNEHVRARHILLKTANECTQITSQIGSEEEFAEMARLHSLDQDSASEGGDLGYFMRHLNLWGFEDKLFEMPLHTIHRFESKAGCHLVWINEYVLSPPPPFDAVKADIREGLEREREVKLLQAFLRKAKSHMRIERLSP